MYSLRQPIRSVLIVVCSGCLASGCVDPRLTAEISRLQEQLEKADKRLEAATQQLDAANIQAKTLRDTVDLVVREAEAAKQKSDLQLAAQAAAIDRARQDAATTISRMKTLESQVTQLLSEKEAAKKQAVFSPIGVWVFPVTVPKLGFQGWVRLTVQEDSEVFVECWEPRTKDIMEDFAKVRDQGWNRCAFDKMYTEKIYAPPPERQLATNDRISAIDLNTWLIFPEDDKKLAKRAWCRFEIAGKATGRIKAFEADLGTGGKDRFGKPIWISVKRVDDAWEPRPGEAVKP